MRILAIDLGTHRTGLALSDEDAWLASPLTTVATTNQGALLAAIQTEVDRWQVQHIILGLPLNMNGTEGPAAARARKFAASLSARVPVPIELVDERLTTVTAAEQL